MANYNVSGLITLSELAKSKESSWCVYIQHETNKGAKYTKGRGPFSLVYQDNCKNRGEASQKECAIKKLTLTDKINLITTNN